MNTAISPQFLMNNYGQRDLTLSRARGCFVWDEDDNRYFDAVMGIAVCGLGHSHPEIAEVIAEQANTLLHCSNLFAIPKQQELAEKLAQASGMESVFFSNSGAEANEAAIKLARLYAREKSTPLPKILVMENAFHGRTMATLSASWGSKVRSGFEPHVENFTHVPFNDLSAVKAFSDDPSVVAIMVEPVQGEAGVNLPAENYLEGLRALCDENEWLLIFDEVQTGNGRTGHHFYGKGHGVLPDITTTAKGLGNGVPIGACMARGRAAALFGPGSHGSTYGGNPLVCAVANRVFDIIQRDNLAENAQKMGAYIVDRLQHELGELPFVNHIRNKGLMIAIELNDDCADLVAQAKTKGLLINVTGGNRIRLLPALNINQSEAEMLTDLLCPIVKGWKG